MRRLYLTRGRLAQRRPRPRDTCTRVQRPCLFFVLSCEPDIVDDMILAWIVFQGRFGEVARRQMWRPFIAGLNQGVHNAFLPAPFPSSLLHPPYYFPPVLSPAMCL